MPITEEPLIRVLSLPLLLQSQNSKDANECQETARLPDSFLRRHYPARYQFIGASIEEQQSANMNCASIG